MILYWIIFIGIIISAFINYKKTVIVWMPLQLLFNDLVAIRYSSPVLSLGVAVNLLLPMIYFSKCYKRENKFHMSKETFFFKPVFIAYIISYAFSFLFSIVPIGTALNTTLKFFMRNFVMVYIFQLCLTDKKAIHLFVKSSFIVCILLALLGTYEFIAKDNPVLDYIYMHAPHTEEMSNRMFYIPPQMGGGYQLRYGMIRANSFFGISIAFGVSCIFYFFLSGFLLKNKYYICNKKLIMLGLISSIMGIFLCNSKTPMFGLIFFIFALCDVKQIFNIRNIVVLAAFIIMLLVLIPDSLNNYISLFDSNVAEEGGGSTVAMRERQMQIALKLFNMNPLFGNGVGALDVLTRVGDNSDILGAESIWLKTLPERGLLGCAVYLFWYAYVWLKCRKILPSKTLFFFLLGLIAMESGTGMLDLALYSSILIAIRKIIILNKMGLIKQRI